MAGIRFQGVSKRFGSVTAVDKSDWEIRDGEFFALLGPSGCGKTTTLRLIAGLESPSEGRIFIGNREVTALPPRERDVGMVFQDYALYPHMTVLDNIGYPLKVRGVRREEIRQRVAEVAANLQIGALLERRPGQLSGGQQQRASVARAVVHHPQVFLFDEPLSNLDAKLRLEARSFLKHLQRQVGVTAVYVTHDQVEALALADRVAVMNHGKIVQLGSPKEIYQRPQNTFVASFIGNPPMNLIPCRRLGSALQSPAFTLDLGPDRLAHIQEGEEVFLGVRPEHLAISPKPTAQSIAGEVYVLEPLGPETLISLRVEETIVTVRLFTDEPPPLDSMAWAVVDPQRVAIYRQSGELVS